MDGVNWLGLLQTFGLAVTVLFFMGLAGWRLSNWLGKEIIIPFRDGVFQRFISFLAHIEATVDKLDINLGLVTRNLEEQTAALHSLNVSSGQACEDAERMAAALESDRADLKIIAKEASMDSKERQGVILAEIKEVKMLSQRIISELEKK
jgi:hypothetical protein